MRLLYIQEQYIRLPTKMKGAKMKKELVRINKLVTRILEESPKTRNSDNLLYLTVIENIHPGVSKLTMAGVLLNQEALNIPCFETVRRTRQKIQAEREDLRATPKVQDYRTAREEAFSEYFGGKQ